MIGALLTSQTGLWKAGVLLGIVVVWAFSCFYAYTAGQQRAEDRINAEVKRAQDEAIRRHGENVVIDMDAAAEVERRRGAAALAAATRRHATDMDIERRRASAAIASAGSSDGSATARVSACDLDSVSVRVLNDTIRAANGTSTPSPSSVPASVPSDPRGTERRGGDGAKMD